MSNLTGGAISEILAQQATADRTADDTAHATADSQRLAARVQDEVETIAGELERAFAELSSRMQDTIRRTSDQLHATEWHGKSREALVAFDSELAQTASTFLTSTQDGVATFRTNLLSFITEFYDTIHNDFATAMGEIQAKYGDAARAAQTYARNLEELDATAITF